MASLIATQTAAATQAASFSSELMNAKAELRSYLHAIEEDRRLPQPPSPPLPWRIRDKARPRAERCGAEDRFLATLLCRHRAPPSTHGQ